MFLGYNTNGLAHHDLFDAVALLADLRYRAIGLTIDHHVLSPRNPHLERHCARLAERLTAHGMRSVVETGARFLLDPRAKHEPMAKSGSSRLNRNRGLICGVNSCSRKRWSANVFVAANDAELLMFDQEERGFASVNSSA